MVWVTMVFPLPVDLQLNAGAFPGRGRLPLTAPGMRTPVTGHPPVLKNPVTWPVAEVALLLLIAMSSPTPPLAKNPRPKPPLKLELPGPKWSTRRNEFFRPKTLLVTGQLTLMAWGEGPNSFAQFLRRLTMWQFPWRKAPVMSFMMAPTLGVGLLLARTVTVLPTAAPGPPRPNSNQFKTDV